jgi:hypothetical protein
VQQAPVQTKRTRTLHQTLLRTAIPNASHYRAAVANLYAPATETTQVAKGLGMWLVSYLHPDIKSVDLADQKIFGQSIGFRVNVHLKRRTF